MQGDLVTELQEENAKLFEDIECLETTLKNFGFTQLELEQIKEGKIFGKIMSEGATRILKERIRQITVEGWDPEHDDQPDTEVYLKSLMTQEELYGAV